MTAPGRGATARRNTTGDFALGHRGPPLGITIGFIRASAIVFSQRAAARPSVFEAAAAMASLVGM